jgi:hypothetical protein
MSERNGRAFDEVNVKPITQTIPDNKNYDPRKYLKPLGDGKNDFVKDVSINSI